MLSTLHVEILCITCQMHLLPNLVGSNKEGLYMMGMETSFFRKTELYSRHLYLTRSNYTSLFLRKYGADNKQNLKCSFHRYIYAGTSHEIDVG